MAKDLFYQLDLNLLRTFLVLSQDLNMRKASERLHISQPAISQALQKLRYHFDDELFVKVHGGLQPTSFAEELTDSITPHLDGLSSAINQVHEFDPKEITQKITIAIPPIILANISAPLFLEIRRLAPNIEIELHAWSKSTQEEIINGQVLIGVHYDINVTKEIISEKLTSIEGRVLVRQEHPITKEVADVSDFSGYEHASVISRGWNDQFTLSAKILNDYGLDAKVAFRSELVSAVIEVTQQTDMLLPHSNLFPTHEYPKLRSITPTFEGKPYSLDVYSHFHKRNRKSALVQWLHSIIQQEILKKLP
ncbi:LysR family transcriptional regulator [Vibrio sp. ZSDE26]|uniref:LysR family transcriptional regulator n=1 Tax=Vibrio amylolyticus TaxID=2847292 RepID=A0A9X1XGA1_9VIBR|nr:LysR family transcriptional regulator [Vibrio amylolyticus]MCK6262532.1 LysR family transcriptional regulator [Vibrio amylolyticus]